MNNNSTQIKEGLRIHGLSCVAFRSTEDMTEFGRYTNEPEPWAIIRYGPHRGKFIEELGKDDVLPPRENFFRFYVPIIHGETPGSDTYKTCGLRDFEVMEAQRAGDWGDILIRAEADVSYTGSVGVEKYYSWGGAGFLVTYESDTLEECGLAEIGDLQCELEKLGFMPEEVDRAFREFETSEKADLVTDMSLLVPATGRKALQHEQ